MNLDLCNKLDTLCMHKAVSRGCARARAASSSVCANDFLLNGSLRGFDLRSRQPPVHKSARCNARGVIAITLWTGPAEWFMAELIPISGIRLRAREPDSSAGSALFLSAFALSTFHHASVRRHRDLTANFINTKPPPYRSNFCA